jgi:hypothetical protein
LLEKKIFKISFSENSVKFKSEFFSHIINFNKFFDKTKNSKPLTTHSVNNHKACYETISLSIRQQINDSLKHTIYSFIQSFVEKKNVWMKIKNIILIICSKNQREKKISISLITTCFVIEFRNREKKILFSNFLNGC